MSSGARSGMWDQIAGSWKQVRGEVRKQWGKLTDDDLEQINATCRSDPAWCATSATSFNAAK